MLLNHVFFNILIIIYFSSDKEYFGGLIMNKQKAALISVFSNTALIIFKVIAGLSMNSISVLSEAVHSGIDLLASIIAFISIRKAVKPEDDDHPFGHGKYENVSGFVEALLIFAAAIIIIYEAVTKLISGSDIGSTGPGMIVMAVSSLINLGISTTLLKISKKTNSIALEADAMHLLTDVFTSLGVFLGLLLIRITGIKILDPIFAIVVALLIIKASIDLTRKSMKDLVDSSLPVEETEQIISIIKKYPQITSYHKLRTRKSGERREVDVHIQMDNSTTVKEAHNLCDEIEDEINRTLKNTYIVLHIEPNK